MYHLVLAKMWGTSLNKSFSKMCCTTQNDVCTVLHPSLSRQFRTNDCQLQYKWFPPNVYSDTLFATTVSGSDNICAQIFATNFGWSCLFPMKMKEVLSLLFQWDVKEIVIGEFNRNVKERLCQLRQTEPFTHDQMQLKKK